MPYRMRERHLRIFLQNIHPILQRQRLEYRIYVIKQVSLTYYLPIYFNHSSQMVNQMDNYDFNRGMLMNVGFLEASKDRDWNCFVFHDVDHLPELFSNPYDCQRTPRHLAVGKNSLFYDQFNRHRVFDAWLIVPALKKFKYRLGYPTFIGGAFAMKPEEYRQVNGHSNKFWGWGGKYNQQSS